MDSDSGEDVVTIQRELPIATQNTPAHNVAAAATTTMMMVDGDDNDSEEVIPDVPGSPEIGTIDSAFANTGIRLQQQTVVIPNLKKRRQEEGYQREDGLPGLYGGGDDKNKKARFGSDYLDEQELRQQMLEQNPDYRFARLVQGKLNEPIEEIIDTRQVDDAVRRFIAQQREEARQRRQSVATIESLRRNLSDKETAYSEYRKKLDRAKRNKADWKLASERYVTAKDYVTRQLEKGEAATLETYAGYKASIAGDLKDEDKLADDFFDILTRTAVMRYGSHGLLNSGFVRDIGAWFQLYFADAVGRFAEYDKNNIDDNANNEKNRYLIVKDGLGPQAAMLALYLSILRSLSRFNGKLAEIVELVKKNGSFVENSVYAKIPSLYVDDLIALADLLMPDKTKEEFSATDNLMLYNEVTLLLVAHINKMLRNSLSSADSIRQPRAQAGNEPPAEPRSRRGKGAIRGGRVLIDIPDIELERLAQGDEEGFTEEQLVAARSKLYVNQDKENTRMAIMQLIAPVAKLAVPRMFYDGVDDVPLSREVEILLDEGGMPDNTRFAVTVPIFNASLEPTETLKNNKIAALFMFAVLLTKQTCRKTDTRYSQLSALNWDNRESYLNMIERLYSSNISGNENLQWQRYERDLRRSLIIRQLLEPWSSVIVLGTHALNDGAISAGDEQKLRDVSLLDKNNAEGKKKENVALEDEAFDIIERRVTGAGANIVGSAMYSQLLKTVSNVHADSYVSGSDREIKDFYDTQFDEAKKMQQQLKKSRDELRKKLEDTLLKTPEEENEEIDRNLRSDYSASRTWAMLPQNSGMMRFRARFISALSSAHCKVRRYCPNLRTVSQESLQRLEETRDAYARLVTYEIIQTEINNPDSYKRDKSFDEIRSQMVSAMNDLKDVILDPVCHDFFGGGEGTGMAFRTPFRSRGYFL